MTKSRTNSGASGISPVWDAHRRSWRRGTTRTDIVVTLFVLLAALILVNTCRPAFGQEREPGDPCPTYLNGPKRKLLSWDDVPGLWFRQDIAKCILGDLKAIPEYQDRIKLLDKKLKLQTEQLDLEKEAREIAAQEADIATGHLEAAERGRRQAEEDRDHWSRSRLLWVGVGATAVILGILVAGQLFDDGDRPPPP